METHHCVKNTVKCSNASTVIVPMSTKWEVVTARSLVPIPHAVTSLCKQNRLRETAKNDNSA